MEKVYMYIVIDSKGISFGGNLESLRSNAIGEIKLETTLAEKEFDTFFTETILESLSKK